MSGDDHLKGLLGSSRAILIVEFHEINICREVGQVDADHSSEYKTVEFLVTYQVPTGCEYLHVKIIVQGTVDLNIESSVIRIRIQQYGIIT